jgi:hypothetical protein
MKSVQNSIAISSSIKFIATVATLFSVGAIASAQTAPFPRIESFAASASQAKISIAGLWTVHSDGVENKNIKIRFGKDDTFTFNCIGAKSEGTYKVHDGVITLVYKKVDGNAVDFEMKKNLPLSADGASFQVDRYRYEKASDDAKS